MSDQTAYAASAQRIRGGGGSVRVTLVAGVGQANAGVSLPCGGCWVQPAIANTEVVKMNIEAAASAILGVDLARTHINVVASSYGVGAAQPMWVPIDDVNKLYFFSEDANAIVDILYLKS